jgi:hypothetical protein
VVCGSVASQAFDAARQGNTSRGNSHNYLRRSIYGHRGCARTVATIVSIFDDLSNQPPVMGGSARTPNLPIRYHSRPPRLLLWKAALWSTAASKISLVRRSLPRKLLNSWSVWHRPGAHRNNHGLARHPQGSNVWYVGDTVETTRSGGYGWATAREQRCDDLPAQRYRPGKTLIAQLKPPLFDHRCRTARQARSAPETERTHPRSAESR